MYGTAYFSSDINYVLKMYMKSVTGVDSTKLFRRYWKTKSSTYK